MVGHQNILSTEHYRRIGLHNKERRTNIVKINNFRENSLELNEISQDIDLNLVDKILKNN
jgi:hypothetical protein